MSNRFSSSFVHIIPFPNLEEVVPAGWEDLRKMSLKDEPRPEEIKEKIKDLEKVSKACVNTIGEGIDAYWLMSKYLEARCKCI